MNKIYFKTDEELLQLLIINKGKYIKEVFYGLEDSYIMFSDTPIPSLTPSVEQVVEEQGNKISILEQQNSQLETALVELASIVGGA